MRSYPTIAVFVFAAVVSGCDHHTPSDQSADVSAAAASDVSQPNKTDREPERKALSERPDAYLSLHLELRQIDSTEWNKAVEQLRTKGNQFTLSIIEELKQGKLTEDQLNSLDELSMAIRKTHPARSLDKSEIQFLLETAAYADLMCHPLENLLRTWTLEYVGAYADSAEIRGELERIRDNYKSELGTETLFDAMDNRVPFYAKQLLTTPVLKE
jgi:hypothetical protein